MKTFEIMERIYENAEAMLGKKYKLTATPDADCEMKIGDEAFIGKTTSGLVTFFYKNGSRITCLTGTEKQIDRAIYLINAAHSRIEIIRESELN